MLQLKTHLELVSKSIKLMKVGTTSFRMSSGSYDLFVIYVGREPSKRTLQKLVDKENKESGSEDSELDWEKYGE